MTLDFLPPQAYTKETLLKAYNWLQGQTEQVREMAATPDQLVSLYLKAKHHGPEALERPSLQSFKSELKNLAGMMGDLEKKQTPQTTPPAQPQYHQPGSTQMGQYQQSPQPSTMVTQPTPQTPPQQPAAQATYQAPVAPTASYQSQTAAPEPSPAQKAASSYDDLTMKMIREVKNELNLSSEMEALRMLVKLGYTKAQTLYK